MRNRSTAAVPEPVPGREVRAAGRAWGPGVLALTSDRRRNAVVTDKMTCRTSRHRLKDTMRSP